MIVEAQLCRDKYFIVLISCKLKLWVYELARFIYHGCILMHAYS